MEKPGYVYILTDRLNRVLYIGVTSAPTERITQHKQSAVRGFTQRYNLTKLVFIEDCGHVAGAILREKQLKGGSRAKKVALIERDNPKWEDVSHLCPAL